jgi:hypothetical protein
MVEKQPEESLTVTYTVGANPDPGATWSEKQPGFDQVEKTTWKKVQFSGCFKTTWESTILRWFQNNLKKYNFQVVLKQPQKKLRIKVAKSHVVQSDFQVVLKTTWNYKNTRKKNGTKPHDYGVNKQIYWINWTNFWYAQKTNPNKNCGRDGTWMDRDLK